MTERCLAGPMTFEITIEKVVYGGAGLGRHEGKVVFVPFSTVGDRLIVCVTQQKKNLIWASIERLLEPGPARRAPLCVHFGTCGGCQWQHIRYAEQVEAKRRILEELFNHRFPETQKLRVGMKPSPEIQGYRSRARIQLRGYGSAAVAGFYGFQTHNVIDVMMCPLFRPALNSALASIRDQRSQSTADPGTSQVDLVCSEEGGGWTSAVVEGDLEEGLSSLGEAGAANTVRPLPTRRVGEFEYRLAPTAFFQANDFMVAELVSTVRELIPAAGTGSALDLFSGVGLFSLPIARRYAEDIAVEATPEASRLCGENAAAAGFTNIRVICADAASWMKALASVAAPSFDLVVLDPPRTGAGAEVMDRIREWAPEAIIYVSCDPQTLARDLASLALRDYRIDVVQGLDLFPQTYHFETVVRLNRR